VEGHAVSLSGLANAPLANRRQGSVFPSNQAAGPPLRYAPVGMTSFSAVTHLGMSGPGGTESSHQRVQPAAKSRRRGILGSSD
jgi:hypothetical protein